MTPPHQSRFDPDSVDAQGEDPLSAEHAAALAETSATDSVTLSLPPMPKARKSSAGGVDGKGKSVLSSNSSTSGRDRDRDRGGVVLSLGMPDGQVT